MKQHIATNLESNSKPLATAATAPQFNLHLVLAVSPEGIPTVAGIDPARVMTSHAFGQEAVGRLAIGMQLPIGTVLLIGHVPFDTIVHAFSQAAESATPAITQVPLSLKCGRSELRLYPDGRVRILGDDVSIEAFGRMALKGAVVELN